MLNEDAKLVHKVFEEISKIFDLFLSPSLYRTWGLTDFDIKNIIQIIHKYVFGDLIALAHKDPSSGHSAEYVLSTYASFRAVMYYRIASCISHYENLNKDLRHTIARKISEYAKTQTLIEIHPMAKIGERFVIDHGTVTVIGETCEIGCDCYILQGVILGATGIAGNNPKKRHPTIGNNVQIGAFARILGPLRIGDNSIINPHCIVTQDIPSNSKVTIINQLQVSSFQNIEIYGLIPHKDNIICVCGKGLSTCTSVSLIDNNFNIVDGIIASIIESDDDYILIQLIVVNRPNKLNNIRKSNLKISLCKDYTIINSSPGLQKILDNL